MQHFPHCNSIILRQIFTNIQIKQIQESICNKLSAIFANGDICDVWEYLEEDKYHRFQILRSLRMAGARGLPGGAWGGGGGGEGEM